MLLKSRVPKWKSWFSHKKSDLKFFLLALCLTAIFFIPLFNKSGKLLYDDAAYEFFPRQIALARSIQNFQMPLWDANRFLGGCPFYADYETGTYSFLLYPFWYMADLDNLENSYFYLYKLPYFFFTLIAWLGFYLFLKSGMKTSAFGAFTGGVIWSLGPHILSDAFLYTSDLLVFAFFPFVLYSVKKCGDENSFSNYFQAGLFQAFMISGGDLNYILRCYLFLFLFILFLQAVRRKSAFIKDRSFYIDVVKLSCFPFLISFVILLPFWAGIGEGISWMFSHDQADMDLTRSYEYKVSLSYLANLLFPDFFGLAKGEKIWGDGWFQFQEFGVSGIMAGGSLMLFFLFNFLHNRASDDSHAFSLGIFLQIVTVFLILIVYTPFYDIAKRLVPYVFSLPYPVYYRFGQCAGMALCIGAAVSYFQSGIKLKTSTLICYLLLTAVFTIIILSFESSFYENINFYKSYEFRTNLFFLTCIQGLALFFIKTNFLWIIFFSIFFYVYSKRESLFIHRNILIFLMVSEFLFFSYLVFYNNSDALPEFRKINDTRFDMVYKKRYTGPMDHPLYKRPVLLNKANDHPEHSEYGERFVSFLSFTDNYSWIFNEFSVFGNDSKPINPVVYDLLKSFSAGFPYQLTLEKINFPLFSNLGVTSFISQKGIIEASGVEFLNPHEDESFRKNNRTDDLNLEYYIKKGRLEEYRIPYEPMSFFSISKEVVQADIKEQFNRIFTEDLKSITFYDKKSLNVFSEKKDYRPGRALTKSRPESKTASDSQSVRQQHRTQNSIEKVITSPNFYDLVITTKRKCLLVVNQCWHRGWRVLVNGREEKIRRVNWFMQAVDLDIGINDVKMFFCPDTIGISLKFSIVFMILFSGLVFIKSKDQ
jgi:hypothetical protein